MGEQGLYTFIDLVSVCVHVHVCLTQVSRCLCLARHSSQTRLVAATTVLAVSTRILFSWPARTSPSSASTPASEAATSGSSTQVRKRSARIRSAVDGRAEPQRTICKPMVAWYFLEGGWCWSHAETRNQGVKLKTKLSPQFS